MDPSRLVEEQSGWEEHAAFMDALGEEGFIVLGGPLEGEVCTRHAVEAESEEISRRLDRPLDDPPRRAAPVMRDSAR